MTDAKKTTAKQTAPVPTPPVPAAAKPTGVTIGDVRSDVVAPGRPAKRGGSSSSYPFDKLTVVGASFGVIGKTARQMASAITNAQKRFAEDKRDENGNIVYQTAKGEGGAIVTTNKPVRVVTRKFYAVDVKPEDKDPDNATVRVYREV